MKTFGEHCDSLKEAVSVAIRGPRLYSSEPLAYRDQDGLKCASCVILGHVTLPAEPVYDADDLVGERDTSDGFTTVATRYYLACSSCAEALHPEDR